MNKAEVRAAVGVLILVAACVGALVQGMREEGRTHRITSLRTWALAGQPHVALFFGNALHLLDAEGRRFARQPLAELSLREEPTDMDWVQAPDGSLQAWFFEDTTPRIVRCVLDTATQRLGQCVQAMAGAQLKSNPASRAVHLAVDGPGQRVYVADAGGHSVRVFEANGQLVKAAERGLLFYPNRLRVQEGGGLLVADNDHHRLAWLDVAGAAPSFALRQTLRAEAHPQAVGSATKVTDVAQDAQSLWMLAVAQGQKHGQVLVFGADHKPVARADLGRGKDPLGIDVLGDSALVADFEGIDLYRVGRRGEFLGAWSGAALGVELQRARQSARAASLWSRAGWIGLALTVLVGLALGFKYRDQPAAPPWPATEVADSEPHAEADTVPLALAQAPKPALGRRPASWVLATVVLVLVAMAVFAGVRFGAG